MPRRLRDLCYAVKKEFVWFSTATFGCEDYMTKKKILPLVLVLAAVGLVLFFRHPASSVQEASDVGGSPSVEELSKRLDNIERDMARMDSDFSEMKSELGRMIDRLEKSLDKMDESGSEGASKEELDNKARGFVKSILEKFMGLVGLIFDRAERELDRKLDEPSNNDSAEKEI